MATSRKVLCALDLGWEDGAGQQPADDPTQPRPLVGAAARAVLAAASREAALDGAELVVLHALPMSPGAPMSPEGIEAVMVQREELASVVIDATIEALEAVERLSGRFPENVPILVEDGPAARAILEAAGRLEAELIVVGDIGAKGLGDALLGSVADAVVHAAPCSVLVVRSRDSRSGRAEPRGRAELI